MASEGRWNTLQTNRQQRLARVTQILGSDLQGRIFPQQRIIDVLHATLEVGDRVCIEGNNQKQADFWPGR